MKYSKVILAISLIITLIGIITGKFFFLFLLLPLGWFNFRKKDKD